MRSSTFSGLAILASALLTEATPLGKRDYVLEDVIVTELITVTALGDGSYKTADGFARGTTTILSTVSETSTIPPAAPAPAETAAPKDKATAAPAPVASPQVQPAVFVQKPKPSSSSVVVIETPEPVVVVVPEPTTLATAVAPVSSSTIAPSTPSTGGSSSKRGLAFNDVSLLKAFTGKDISWCYNWGSSVPGTTPGLEYVPMLWGTQNEHTKNWAELSAKAIAAGSTHVLSFNEPDHPDQAKLTIPEAVAGHIKWMNPLAGGNVKIGAPAVTNGPVEKSMGLEGYLKPFLAACTSCKIDFVPIHWYDSASNFAYFKLFIEQAHDIAKKPLWITEFAASGSQEEQAAFLDKALPFLDSLDYVERYSYFMVSEGNLITNKALSTVGAKFAS